MDGFAFLFSFYSLLLGLAVAHVTTGFADSWLARAETALGASTLLLGLLVLLRAAEQWTSFWGGRDSLSMGPWMVLTCLGMALPYIFISRATFPRADHRHTRTDDYYQENKRALMVALLIPPCVSLASNVCTRGTSWLGTSWLPLLGFALKYALPLAIPLALIFSKRQLWHRVGLGLLVACTFTLMF